MQHSKGQRESPAPCWRAAKPRAKGCTCTCVKYNTTAKPISSGVSKSHGSSTFTGGRYSWTVQLDSPDAMYKALCCCPGGQSSWTPAVPALQHNQRALTERAAMPSCNTQLDCPSTLLLSLYMLTQALRKTHHPRQRAPCPEPPCAGAKAVTFDQRLTRHTARRAATQWRDSDCHTRAMPRTETHLPCSTGPHRRCAVLAVQPGKSLHCCCWLPFTKKPPLPLLLLLAASSRCCRRLRA